MTITPAHLLSHSEITMLANSALIEPPKSLSILEFRAAFDVATVPTWLIKFVLSKPENLGDGKTVFVLPGFGAGDGVMSPMRSYLRHFGFNALGWGLGINKAGLDKPHSPEDIPWLGVTPSPYKGEGGVAYLADLMIQKVVEAYDRSGQPISLVGWSLGGTIAREVARELPDVVDQVITLGSPIIGGPKYTRAARYLGRQGLDLDWIEKEVARRNNIPLRCKTVAIVSRTDGIVDWSASVADSDTHTRYVMTDVAHLGMGLNRSILEHVKAALIEAS